MSTTILLPALPTLPIASDMIDDVLAAHQATLAAALPVLASTEDAAATLAASVTALTARVAALEAKGTTPPTGATGTIVSITAAQEAQLAAVALGGYAILRGPAQDIILIRS